MTSLEQRYKKISANLAALSPVQKKKKEKKSIKSPFQYKALRGSLLDTKVYPKTLKSQVASLANFKPKERVVEKPVYLGEPGRKGERGEKGLPGRDGKNGETPVKGIHYFTTEEIEAVKKEIATELETKIPEIPEQLEVNQELVKKIVAIMHTLPEADKLEVSKGIRNAQSFIYGGTKYKTSELMHGAGSSTGGGFTALSATETPNGVLKVFTFASATAQPSYLVVDNVWMKAVTKSGTVNWTWLGTQATLTIPPVDDIWGVV